MKIIILILLLLSFSIIKADNSLDSLLNLYNNAQNNSEKIELLERLSQQAYHFSIDSAIFFNKLAVDYAIKTSDNELITNKLLDLGKMYLYGGKYDSSVVIFLSAIPYAKKTNNKKLIYLAIHSVGNGYLYQGNNTKALNYYFEALEIREQINDISGIAASTNNIGMIYAELKQYDLALKYLQISLSNEKKLNNQENISSAYNNIGLIFWSINELDSATFYYKKALKIRETLQTSDLKLANSYGNIALVFEKKELHDSALFYNHKALRYSKLANNPISITNDYNNIAKSLLLLNKNKESLVYLDSSFFICQQLNDYQMFQNLYDIFAQNYYNLKEFDKAYKYVRKYAQYKDSVASQNLSTQIAEMQVRYETEKQQKVIEVQKLNLYKKDTELKFQKKILLLLSIFSFIVIFLLIFLARLYYQKRKAHNLLQDRNEEITVQNESLNKQKEEITTQRDRIKSQNKILHERNNKISIQQKEITDSILYAKRIQTAIFPPKEIILENFTNHFIFFKPRNIVSGDFYWVAKKENLSFVAAVDCTGHGVPGAFMSMLGVSFLNEIINKNTIKMLSASEILNQLRNYIKNALRQKGDANETRDGMDIALCVFDFEQDKLQFAGAKNPLVIIRNNQITIIKGDKMPISFNTNERPFKNNDINIRKDDMFYMYSDGYIDQFGGEKDKKFSKKRFRQLLLNISELPIDEQKNTLENTLNSWIKSGISKEQIDDILVLGIRY